MSTEYHVKRAVIYCLIDPRTEICRYVGKALDASQRLIRHVWDAKNRPGSPKDFWIRGMLEAGVRPLAVVLEECNLDLSDEAERFWIAYLRFVGCDLLNLTAGGAGIVDPSPSTRQKMRASQAGRKYPEEKRRALSLSMRGEGNHFFGRVHSESSKLKVSQSKTGVPSAKKGLPAPEGCWRYRLKKYVLISPGGEEFAVDHLARFCKEHGLTRSTLLGAMPGKKWTHHKGWKIRPAS